MVWWSWTSISTQAIAVRSPLTAIHLVSEWTFAQVKSCLVRGISLSSADLTLTYIVSIIVFILSCTIVFNFSTLFRFCYSLFYSSPGLCDFKNEYNAKHQFTPVLTLDVCIFEEKVHDSVVSKFNLFVTSFWIFTTFRYTSLAVSNPHLLLSTFLPVLLFESAFAMDVHIFYKMFTQVSLEIFLKSLLGSALVEWCFRNELFQYI